MIQEDSDRKKTDISFRKSFLKKFDANLGWMQYKIWRL